MTESTSPQDTLKQVNQHFAVAYVNKHWEVFPVHSSDGGKCSCRNARCSDIGKHPRTKNGFKDASTDLTVIDQYWGQWPDANIGVRTGLASGVVVIDVDPKHGGLETWMAWQDEHGAVDTFTVSTGGGGWHYYFKADGIAYETNESKVGKGIDIRAEAGYAILPPSSHESGGVYDLENETEIKSLPEWLKAKLPRRGESSSKTIPAPSSEKIQEGERNSRLARTAGALVRQGVGEAVVLESLRAQNSEFYPPLDDSEVAKVAQSISRYEPSAGPPLEPLAVTYLDGPDFDVMATHEFADGQLVIGARELRREKTGIHGVVEVRYGKALLGYNTFNLGRSGDRHELSRRCHGQLDENLRNQIPKELLASYIDYFCLQAYPESLKSLSPTLVMGDSNIPINMICGDFVIEGGISIMFAAPGDGKSWTAMLMATSVDAGKHTLWNVRQQKILYLNLERSQESIQRRIGWCNEVLDLEPKRPLHVLSAKGKSLAAVSDSLRRYIEQEGIQVVFLDSISRSGAGSLINDEDTNRTIDLMNDICPTWLAIAHSPRADSSHVYGSVHFEAGADLMVSLTSEVNDNLMGVGLKVTKSNDTPKRPMEKFVLEFGGNRLVHARKAKPGEFAEIESKPKPTAKDALVEYLKEHGQISATQAQTELGVNRGDASNALSTDPRFEFKGKEGKHSMYGLKDKDVS